MNEVLKEYIPDVDLTGYKYMRIDFSNEMNPPGFVDQMFQLKMYLQIAHELGLILILPRRTLAIKHNNGISVPLVCSEYYDINSIKVNGMAVNVVTSIFKSSCDDVLQINPIKRKKLKSGMYDPLLKISEELGHEVTIEPCKGDVEFARKFVELNKIEGCIHVRRTDRCSVGHWNLGLSGHDWDIANRPKNILSLLDGTNAPKNIYIMTDMPPSDPIIEELRNQKKYNFMFLYDFPKLVGIKSKNNYKVFNMETCIMAIAPYKQAKEKIVKFYIDSKNRK